MRGRQVLGEVLAVEGEEVTDLAALHVDDGDTLAGVDFDGEPGPGRYPVSERSCRG